MKHFTQLLSLLLAFVTGQAAHAQCGVMTSTDDVRYEYYVQSFAANSPTLEFPASGTFFHFFGNGTDAKFIFKANSSQTGAYSLYVTNANDTKEPLPVTLAEETVSGKTTYNLGYSTTSSDAPTPIYVASDKRPTGGDLSNHWGLNFYATRSTDSKYVTLKRDNTDKSTQRLVMEQKGNEGTSSNGPWFVFRVVPASPAPMVFAAGSAYATYSTGVNATVPDGIKAYTATLNENGYTLDLQEVTGGTIPAYNGVILARENTGSQLIEYPKEATETGNFPEKNELVATSTGEVYDNTNSATPTKSATEAITMAEENPVTTYILGKPDENSEIGFYKLDQTSEATRTIGAYKAYLTVSSTTAQSAQGIGLAFPDGTTSIVKVLNTDDGNAPVYDLSGRRVMQTTKGTLYIKNGKKFLAL